MDLSSVQPDHLPGDAQSQSEMFFIMVGRIHPVKSFKYQFFFIVRDSRAVICHLDHSLFPFLGKV